MKKSKGKMSKKKLAKLRALLKHLGRHKGKYGFLAGLGTGGILGIDRGISLANYSPGDKRALKRLTKEQKTLRRLLQQQQRR